MESFLELIRRNPVRLVAAIQTTLAASVLFTPWLTEAQLGAVIVCIAAWLAFGTESQVEAKHDLKDRLDSLNV